MTKLLCGHMILHDHKVTWKENRLNWGDPINYPEGAAPSLRVCLEEVRRII